MDTHTNMIVLFSLFSCNPNKGGEPGRSWNWAISCAETGHQVHCLTRASAKEEIDVALQQISLPNITFHYINVPKWVEFFKKFHPIGMYLYYLVWQRFAYLRAKKLDITFHFDVIHHVSWGSLQMGTQMWRLDKKLIFGPVGGGQLAPKAFKKYFMSEWRSEVIRSWVSKVFLLLNPHVKKTLKKANLVLAENSDTYKMAEKFGAKNIQLFLDSGLAKGGYPTQYPQKEPSKKLKMLYVGRLFPRRGIKLVLEALSTLPPTTNFSLTILGGGDLEGFIPQWITELQLEEKVVWEGQVPWESVKAAYLSHDVFIFCSLRDSFGSQLLEAMIYGLPVITLDHHGAGDFIPDSAGFKIPVTTPEETSNLIAESVEKMHENSHLRIEMGKEAYDFAHSQMWPAKKPLVKEIYRSLES